MSRPALGGRRFGDVVARGRGAVTEWGPLDEPDLEVMLRADLGVTLVTGKVSAWADQSPNGRDVTQAVVAKRPVVSTFSGRDALLFNSANAEFLESILYTPQLTEPTTIYVVLSASTPTGAMYAVDSAIPGGGVGRTRLFWGTTNWTVNSLVAGAVLSDNAICHVADAVDAVYSDMDFTTAAVTGVDPAGIPAMTVGTSRVHALGWNGTISEILVFGSAHDAAKRAQLAAYFNGLYGLAIT